MKTGFYQSAALLVLAATTTAFQSLQVSPAKQNNLGRTSLEPLGASKYEDSGLGLSTSSESSAESDPLLSSRRTNLKRMGLSILSVGIPSLLSCSDSALADVYEARDAERKYVQESYEDFTKTKEGWLYREVKPGSGEAAKEGDRVVFDWSGYTIGYFGRPFQAKGGPQGGAFDKDLDYERTVIGSGKMVKGLELALTGMKPGEVRQVVIPYQNDLSYPADDPTHERVGPKPSTFSGQRALNFVLDNPRLDRTMLFNVKVIRVDKSNGKGGFTRG